MSGLWSDARSAARSAVRSPGLTLSVTVTLGLGVGANLAVLVLVYGALIRPAPNRDPAGLVVIENTGPYYFGDRETNEPFLSPDVSSPDFDDFLEQQHVFTAMGALSYTRPAALRGPERTHPVGRVFVTSRLFDLLSVRPTLGRLPGDEDFRPGGSPVAVLTEGFWRREYRADPSVVGQSVQLDGQVFTIVGVLPPGVLTSLEEWKQIGVWPSEDVIVTPLVRGRAGEEEGSFQFDADNRDVPWMTAYARLAPRVRLAEAQTHMDVIARRLQLAYPATNAGRSVRLVPLDVWRTRGVRSLCALFLGVAALTLLIAVVNTVGMMWIDGVRAAPEMAARAALGAGPVLLLRHYLLGCVIRSLPAGVAALAFGGLILAAAEWNATRGLPSLTVLLKPWVIAVGMTLAVLASLAAAAGPAWELTTPNLMAVLREGGIGASSSKRRRLSIQATVALQIGIATALAFAAGLLIKSMWGLLSTDLDIDRRSALAIQVRLPTSDYPTKALQDAFVRRALDRIRSLPVVESAAVTWSAPLSPSVTVFSGDLEIQTPDDKISVNSMIQAQYVGPGYFETLRLRLLAGAWFTEAQEHGGARVAVVDEAFCQKYLPKSDPLHAQIRLGKETLDVMGVVASVRHGGPAEPAEATLYLLHSRTGPQKFFYLVVRARAMTKDLPQTLLREIATVDSTACVEDPVPLNQFFAMKLAARQRTLVLVGGSAAIALLLTVLGLMSAFGQYVGTHARDIAVRVALGAGPWMVSRFIGAHLGWTLAVGVALGVVGGASLARVLASELYGVTPTDLTAAGSALGVIVIVVVVAAAGPTWKAITIDPSERLRVT